MILRTVGEKTKIKTTLSTLNKRPQQYCIYNKI